MSIDVIIGIIMILSFIGMAVYCVKGLNLMVGFAVMATLWTVLALIGNTVSPNSALTAMASEDTNLIIKALTYVYADGPAAYAQSILVNIFFGAFFGRVLIETGIASTLIRKVVELGGDKPRFTMALLCVVTAIIFMSMTGIGPVISIAVIVLPILLSLGVPSPIALFSFMGSIMAGIFGNVVNFKQYQTIYAGFNEAAESYTFNDYFHFGVIAMIVALVVVLVVSNVALAKRNLSHSWAAGQAHVIDNAPAYSWISVILPVVGVVALKLPIILGFILSSIYALATTGKLKGKYDAICSMFAKLFMDGAVDVAPMIGFLLTLSMFNNAATFAAPYFTAILGNFVPTSALVLCIVFGVFTPLGFFRGPMNLVGCGLAILGVVVSVLPDAPVAFLYPLFAITTIAPQHLDITQSWVAWGLGYTKVSSKDYMKMSIPTGWIVGIILCAVVFVVYGSLM